MENAFSLRYSAFEFIEFSAHIVLVFPISFRNLTIAHRSLPFTTAWVERFAHLIYWFALQLDGNLLFYWNFARKNKLISNSP